MVSSLDQLLIKHPNATFIDQTNGDIIVANYNGCFVCKLIDKAQALLLSASSKHPPIQITAEDEFQLEGVVTRSIRLHQKSPEIILCTH